MSKTVEAVFDGEVFRPEAPPGLPPNTRCRLTITEEREAAPTGNVWDTLEALAGTVEAPEDWSAEHDHYLYGTPKRGEHRR